MPAAERKQLAPRLALGFIRWHNKYANDAGGLDAHF